MLQRREGHAGRGRKDGRKGVEKERERSFIDKSKKMLD